MPKHLERKTPAFLENDYQANASIVKVREEFVRNNDHGTPSQRVKTAQLDYLKSETRSRGSQGASLPNVFP